MSELQKRSGSIELIGGPMFSGKCLGRDTLVMMASGYHRKVQDIKPNDQLMGDDSTPRTVMSTSEGRGELYMIHQTDGVDYMVNGEHVLSLKNSCAYDENHPVDHVVDLSVKDYLDMADGTFEKFYKGYRNKILFSAKQAPGMRSRPANDFDAYTAGVIWQGQDCIKDCIRFNILSIRENWLVGHLETFGEVIARHEVTLDIREWGEHLAKQFTNLVRSLGLVIKTNYAGKLWVRGNYLHRLPWRVFDGKIIPPREFNRDELLSTIRIEARGDGPYYGFTLDGNHRFMLADGTVTHNTTELLRRLFCDASVKRKILYINHAADVRTAEPYSTHNPLYREQLGRLQNVTMISCSSLPSLEEIQEYDTIGIDEGNFFDDLSRVEEYADNGKSVIVAGLIGDANRRKFGKIADLLPIAEEYTSLHALCVKCAEHRETTKASFTLRLAGKLDDRDCADQIDVGGADKYIPVCRKHYLELSKE